MLEKAEHNAFKEFRSCEIYNKKVLLLKWFNNFKEFLIQYGVARAEWIGLAIMKFPLDTMSGLNQLRFRVQDNWDRFIEGAYELHGTEESMIEARREYDIIKFDGNITFPVYLTRLERVARLFDPPKRDKELILRAITGINISQPEFIVKLE